MSSTGLSVAKETIEGTAPAVSCKKLNSWSTILEGVPFNKSDRESPAASRTHTHGTIDGSDSRQHRALAHVWRAPPVPLRVAMIDGDTQTGLLRQLLGPVSVGRRCPLARRP